MKDYTPDKELAPRDIVARAIVYEMQKTRSDHVFLDVTHLPPARVTTRFPHIYRFCLSNGIDITRELIPVAPAAHYLIGGVKVNTWGETNVPGIFAVGEVACTGVHGANHLASNSLLEAIIFSKRIIERTTQPRQKLKKTGCKSGQLLPGRFKKTVQSSRIEPIHPAVVNVGQRRHNPFGKRFKAYG